MSKFYSEQKEKEMRVITDYLLTKYYHRHTEYGVDVLLTKAVENKKSLLELLSKMPGYNGNGQVVIDYPMERVNVPRDVYHFVMEFGSNIGAKRKILKTKNKNGKTMHQIIAEENNGQPGVIKVNKISDIKFRERSLSDEFSFDGKTRESVNELIKFNSAMNIMCANYEPTINDGVADSMNKLIHGIRATQGQKTSRLFNKVCDHFGLAEQQSGSVYQKQFSEYSDLVSGAKRQMKMILSVNPIDFLTMSFGNSWASCHTIDKANQRRAEGNYSGAYCGGTLSYMLDSVTIIMYIVPSGCFNSMSVSLPNNTIMKCKEHPELLDKVYRNLFHWNGNGGLIQARIYPRGNDGATDLYKKFRLTVEEQIANALGVSNSWSKPTTDYNHAIISEGMHYRDYNCFSSCRGVLLNGIDNANFDMVIGHEGICVYCGEEYSYQNRLGHTNCSDADPIMF